MECVTVPPEVTATLRAAGYAVRGPAGVGSGGPVWTAVGPHAREGGSGPGGDRVVVHPLSLASGSDDAGRLDALCALDHPHLARLVGVLPVGTVPADPSGGVDVLVLVEEVPGTTLAAVLAARGPLAAGEVVTLTVPLAGALDALHRAGLAHGDVSPGNVVVRPDGRPVLIDLLGAVTGPAGHGGRGTPGFVAPEVRAGQRVGDRGRGCAAADGWPGGSPGAPGTGVPPGAPADVFALATVALTALDPATADGPLGQELAAACSPDPVLRPTAGELAAGCWARAIAAPIGLPDAGVLARTALARLATEQRTMSVDRRSRHRAARAPRRASRQVPLVAASVLVVLTAVTPAGTVRDLVRTEPGVRPESSPRVVEPVGGTSGPAARPDAVPARQHPVAAAVELTERRAQVLTAGDRAALVDVAAEGGPAHAADLALMDRLAADAVRLEGLAAADVAAVPVGVRAGATAPAARVDVAVTSGVTAHRRHGPDGVVEVPAQPARTVVLGLVWTADGWRVEQVRAVS